MHISSLHKPLLLIVAILVTLTLFIGAPGQATAQTCPYDSCVADCLTQGQCSSERSKICVLRNYGGVTPVVVLTPEGAACGAGEGKQVIGNIYVPGPINRFNNWGGEIGVFNWLNTVLILFFSICVVWFMVQLVLAGAKIITNPGEAKGMEELKEAVTYPIIGMILLAASFLIVTLIGIFFFDSPTFITNPVLPRAQDFVETTE